MIFDGVVFLAGILGEIVELEFGDLVVGEVFFNDGVARRAFRVPSKFPVAFTETELSTAAVVLLNEMFAAFGILVTEHGR